MSHLHTMKQGDQVAPGLADINNATSIAINKPTSKEYTADIEIKLQPGEKRELSLPQQSLRTSDGLKRTL